MEVNETVPEVILYDPQTFTHIHDHRKHELVTLNEHVSNISVLKSYWSLQQSRLFAFENKPFDIYFDTFQHVLCKRWRSYCVEFVLNVCWSDLSQKELFFLDQMQTFENECLISNVLKSVHFRRRILSWLKSLFG